MSLSTILTSATGTASTLARHVFVGIDGLTTSAHPNAVLVEEFGLAQKLPAALVASGHFAEVERHTAISAWGVNVVELELTNSVPTESE